MKVENLVIWKKYTSTAFPARVKLISIDKIENGVATVTVEYRGKAYFDFSFSLSD